MKYARRSKKGRVRRRRTTKKVFRRRKTGYLTKRFKRVRRTRVYKKRGALRLVKNQSTDTGVRDAYYKANLRGYRLPVKKIASLGNSKVVFRYQGIQPDDVNVGWNAIIWTEPTVASGVVPLHIYPLSTLPNGGVGITDPGYEFKWTSTASTGDFSKSPIGGRDATGGIAGAPPWYPEVTGGVVDYGAVTKALHAWTSVKLQLFGAKKMDTKFTVTLFRFKESYANIVHSTGDNPIARQMLTSLTAPYLSDRLNNSTPRAMKEYMSVVKEWNVTVPRLADDLNSGFRDRSTRRLNIFIRHNVMNNYNWADSRTDGVTPHDETRALGFGFDTTIHTTPKASSELLLMVRATCPRFIENDADFQNFGASYDMIIRNCFYVPT